MLEPAISSGNGPGSGGEKVFGAARITGTGNLMGTTLMQRYP
jgi:hypothetical protein